MNNSAENLIDAGSVKRGSTFMTMESATLQPETRMHFKNPPIVEAVIALRVPEMPDSSLDGFREAVPEPKALGYDLVSPTSTHQVVLNIESGVSTLGSEDRQLFNQQKISSLDTKRAQ